MDLLSSYDDEASSTPKSEQTRLKSDGMMKEESLSSEWGNVEKANENTSASASEPEHSVVDQNEEDESHLPPGVRRHNRYHSSSSSSEDEAEKAKNSKDADSSDSDSDKSDHKASTLETLSSVRRGSKSESKYSSRDKDATTKGRHSRSRSASRSRSRSRSPRRRRRSSDRSRHSRSRSRDRRHKKDRRRRSHRSRSKDRRRSRDRHRHKRDHRRSRSRSRDRRDRHKDRRRSRSRGRRSRSRSGDRRRERSHSPSPVGKVIKFGDKVIKPGASFGRPSNFSKPLSFKEKMRQQLIKAMEDGTDVNQALTNKDGTALCTQSAGIHQQQSTQAAQPKKPPVPLMANLVTSTATLAAMTVTASEAAMQSMLALQKEATEKTGVEIPKYYNPAAINPMKYVEQVQKRKLLWSRSKEKDVKSQWHATSLSGDHDDKSKEKFRKLMGIKEDSPGEEGGESAPGGGEMEEKQKQLFDQLHKEYQYARMATHTHRGIGLGFGSSNYQDPAT